MNDSLLTVTVVSTSPDTVLELAGELDLASLSTLTAALESIALDGGSVILDVSELTFLDSSGMGVIARRSVETREAGGRLLLRSPRPNVLKTLQVVGLDGLVAADPDADAPDTGTPAA